jgi:hypothetical protein
MMCGVKRAKFIPLSVCRSLDGEGAIWVPVEEGCYHSGILDLELNPVTEWAFKLSH